MEGLYDDRENLTNRITSMEQMIFSKESQIETMGRSYKE